MGMKRWDIDTFLHRGLELIHSVGGVDPAGSGFSSCDYNFGRPHDVISHIRSEQTLCASSMSLASQASNQALSLEHLRFKQSMTSKNK